jgi:hypothetical protein
MGLCSLTEISFLFKPIIMSQSDEEFRDEFKPLQVPPYFDPAISNQDKVVFALAQLGEGSAEDVILELSKYHSHVDHVPYLQVLFDKGLIKGEMSGGVMHYNLGKITTPNQGKV